MPGDASDIDIEALLDAPLLLKNRQQQQQLKANRHDDKQRSALDVIEQAKDESRRRDHHHHDEHRNHHGRDYRDDRDRDRDHGHRNHRSRSPGRAAPPVSEAQRDRRTVFCRQLAQRVRTADLHDFCAAAGPIREVSIVYDKISGRSKGVAYVEFVEEATVQKALGLTGQKLAGIPIIIELTETEKNRLAEEAAETARRSKSVGGASSSLGSNGPVGSVSFSRLTRVFVGGLHPSLDEPALRKVFEPFGDIDQIEMQPSASTATVSFRNGSDAAMAVDQMNGFQLAGRAIRVGILRDRPDGNTSVQGRQF